MLRDYELGVEIINRSPSSMQGAADTLNTEELRQAVESLESVAFNAVWRAAYLEMRYGSGCGDQGHEDAVKQANKVLKAVRKAMGYYVTHPIRV